MEDKMYHTTTPHWMHERTPAFQPGTYTDIDHLLYSLVYMIMERERQRMGWLNPYARPFIPETTSQNQEQNKTEGKTKFSSQPPDTTTNCDKTSPRHSHTNIDKETTPTAHKIDGTTIEIPTKYKRINKILAPAISDRRQTTIERDTIIQRIDNTKEANFGWKVAKKTIKKPTIPKTTKINIQHKNRYQVLEDVDEVEHNNVVVPHIIKDIKLEETVKDRNRLQQTIEHVNEQYEVEMMTVKAVEVLLLEHHRRAKEEPKRNAMEQDCGPGADLIRCYSECTAYLEQNEKRMLNGEIEERQKACQDAKDQCDQAQQKYQILLENHQKLEEQYDKLSRTKDELENKCSVLRKELWAKEIVKTKKSYGESRNRSWRKPPKDEAVKEAKTKREEERRNSKYKSEGYNRY